LDVQRERGIERNPAPAMNSQGEKDLGKSDDPASGWRREEGGGYRKCSPIAEKTHHRHRKRGKGKRNTVW